MTSVFARSWAPEAAGAAYELGRPDYPPELGDLLAKEVGLGSETTLVDLAAGTGKLTRCLEGQVGHALAVEPMAGMRTQLRRAVPGVVTVAGTAEQLPLRSGSVDVVTVAQAFHWFDAERASRELRRVLALDGALVLVNNIQESSDPLSNQLWRVLQRFEHAAPRPDSIRGWRTRLERTHDFERWQHFTLAHEHLLTTPAELEARFDSVSFVLLLPAEDRAALAAALRETVGHRYPVRLPLRTVIDIGWRAGDG